MNVKPVAVPDEIKAIAADWHGGQASMLYAVASTGGLTPPPRYANFTEADQADHMWGLWHSLDKELSDPLAAGDIDPDVVADVSAVADIYRELADALESGGDWPAWASHLRG
jgi:hypothetical protein